VGASAINSSAYDTAWIARLGELDTGLAQNAIEWLRWNQLPDGSWGASWPVYYHDRFVCTLSALVALAKCEVDSADLHLDKARDSLETSAHRLGFDAAGISGAFEVLVPTLLSEAAGLGLVSEYNDLVRDLTRVRAAKLRKVSKIDRNITPAFSIEMVGPSGIDLLDVDNLQEENGSVGCSPSATAFFALHVRRGDTSALAYLRDVAANDDGGVPYVAPIDVFEYAWTLRSLALLGAGALDEETLALCEPVLDFLQAAWTPGEGIASVAGLGFKDGDATSCTFDALASFGRAVDIEAVLHYEEHDHFRCYALEPQLSVSTNIHALSALRAAGCGKEHPAVQKTLRFLWRTRTKDALWLDKWHLSPYYPTSHAVIAMAGYEDGLASQMGGDAVGWIQATQNADGSWGFYGRPTAEETAYVLQALATWKRSGKQVQRHVLENGATWLVDRAELPYAPMWIGKCLYCPELVVRAAILSAVAMVKEA
jgi:halimadienyl-diphosphate synthase